MGMDVCGVNPTTEAGRYFCNNLWWWLPLANYIIQNGPVHLVSKVKHWKSNDGDGLDADDAAELAKWLREDLASGAVKDYEERRNAFNGYGEHESFEASYGFSEHNVAEFATFLEGSGGFQIW